MTGTLDRRLTRLGLVAILRGVEPDEVVAIGQALLDAGFEVIEVPLNSPRPLDSIRRLADAFAERAIIGAGTVLDAGAPARIRDAGGTLVVMPHGDGAVVRAAKDCGLHCVPGVATPTEAFAALAAGADGLKMFPAEALPPVVVKAWRAVLPRDVALLPVGGITPASIAPYRAAGASGFGLGSALYRPGMDATAVAERATAFAAAWAASDPQGTD
ncbi:MAG: 2-dehydro-3-deoxy-6-phosphogalactonate aldolase [Ectothiorhodospiraceae bacterium]|nr:2-dehydro-3-deoxy-6-phosphogalactonate aldolase [Ectothiorhodospiraceae bacterium]